MNPRTDTERAIRRRIERCCARVLTMRAETPPSELLASVYLRVYARSRQERIDLPLWDTAFIATLQRLVPDTHECTLSARREGDKWITRLDDIDIELPGTAVIDGDVATVQSPALDVGSQPGFIARVSQPALPLEVPVRIYLAVRPVHAAIILGDLCRRFGAELRMGWAVKTAANPLAYSRADAAVCYIDASELDNAVGAVSAVFDEAVAQLRRVTPLFTTQVSPGVAIACEPPDAFRPQQLRSHGMWVAETLVAATENAASAHRAADKVAEILHSQGRNMLCPAGIQYQRACW